MAKDISSKFKKARLTLGLSQKEFSGMLGIAQGYLSDIENGHKIPSDTLVSLFSFTVGSFTKEKHENKTTRQVPPFETIKSKLKEEKMYKEKYLILAEQHIQLIQELVDLKNEILTLKKARRPSHDTGKRA